MRYARYLCIFILVASVALTTISPTPIARLFGVVVSIIAAFVTAFYFLYAHLSKQEPEFPQNLG